MTERQLVAIVVFTPRADVVIHLLSPSDFAGGQASIHGTLWGAAQRLFPLDVLGSVDPEAHDYALTLECLAVIVAEVSDDVLRRWASLIRRSAWERQ